MDDVVCGALTCRSCGNFVILDLAAQPATAARAADTAVDLAEMCSRIAWDERVRVVVLSFDGSLDGGMPPAVIEAEGMEGPSLVEPVAALKQPVIAAIRGDALGPGLELALACDIRIGTDRARFGLPQIQYGCMPSSGGTQRLPRLIGLSRAMQMILTGETVGAEEAADSGLIHRIVQPEDLLQSAMDMAREMAEKSPLSLSFAKEALHKGLDLTLEQGIRMEQDLYLLLFSTADRVEGVRAFREKRKPQFEGV